MGLTSGFGETGLRQDGAYHLGVEPRLASGTGSILLDAGETEQRESAASETDGIGSGSQLLGNLEVLQALGSTEDDAGAEHETMRGRPAPYPALELGSLRRGQQDGRGHAHGPP